MLPFPCRTGAVKIGKPGRDAPVLLTCNFGLTVERVKRALAGRDAWLLVANSRGVNVWCAATGGLLTNHDVVSVVKTSGIEELVDHRELILPQLAATGVEGRVVRKKTGWRVVWGPVDAAAIPAFLDGGGVKTPAMGRVTFPLGQRLEMAVAWAFPISLLALPVAFFSTSTALLLAGLTWAHAIVLFAGFPLYESWLRGDRGGKAHIGLVFFDFGERGAPLVLWLLTLLCAVALGALGGDLSWAMLLRWGLVAGVVALVLGIDLSGSTPTYKSGLHADRLLAITLEESRCRGVGFCLESCPVEVFELDRERSLAVLASKERCVQCGACVVQCPFDALYFEDPAGGRITPETVRSFKLNLMGTRSVATSAEVEHEPPAENS
ncbi:MAG: 4Fe-4S dicluster domain-containing protein [Deltaproteobacteria bacterium]|nr:4Fe-4S dicluster domain-containing protein [Deltaproteobacteria bacterium]MBW2420228.1 4Fe-4S dicluster domain-containing protein [Deltaproteobacteria bacterium]